MNYDYLRWLTCGEKKKSHDTISSTAEVSDITRLVFEVTIGDATKKYLYKKEEWIKLHIRPKPKYLPNRIWRWLLSKLIYLETFTKEKGV